MSRMNPPTKNCPPATRVAPGDRRQTRLRDPASAQKNCIFCQIIKGKIPSTKLYQDEHCLAILDINPINPGHILLISKNHYETLLDAPPEIVTAIMQNTRKVIEAVVKATQSEGFNIIQNNGKCAGQLIPHLHFHLIPRRSGDDVHFGWNPRPYQKGELKKIAASIAKELRA